MKKKLIILVIGFCLNMMYAEDDLFKENGKLIERIETEEIITELRLFEIRNFKGGDRLYEVNTIYDNYIDKNIIGKLDYVHELINIHKVYIVIEKSNKRRGELWFEISTKTIKGWLCYDDILNWNYFAKGNYTITEIIESGNKIWTIRKLEQPIAFLDDTEIRDKPGLDGNIIAYIKDCRGITEYMYAITEETDKVDGDIDHWIKISYENNKYGWIHGSKVYVERGGPKYETPENEIKFMLGDEP